MKYTLGVDEAGRGPLAGPVAVGVVAVAEGYDILANFPGLNDSKQLSEKKREVLFQILQEEIKKGNVRAVVQMVSAKLIDEGGIAPAIKHSVATGVRKLLAVPDEGKVFLDGALHAPDEYEQETIIGGDGIVPAIMLASIAAKVTRDKHMVKISELYPEYDFAKHKGYGTKAHIAAIKKFGVSDEHRQTFLKKIL